MLERGRGGRGEPEAEREAVEGTAGGEEEAAEPARDPVRLARAAGPSESSCAARLRGAGRDLPGGRCGVSLRDVTAGGSVTG